MQAYSNEALRTVLKPDAIVVVFDEMHTEEAYAKVEFRHLMMFGELEISIEDHGGENYICVLEREQIQRLMVVV